MEPAKNDDAFSASTAKRISVVLFLSDVLSVDLLRLLRDGTGQDFRDPTGPVTRLLNRPVDRQKLQHLD